MAEPPGWAERGGEIAVEIWSDRLRLDLGDPPPIIWFEGKCLDYGDGGGCLIGHYAHTPLEREIHLAVVPGTPTGSALVHELLHWALDERDGDSDGDHEERAWRAVGSVENAMAYRLRYEDRW